MFVSLCSDQRIRCWTRSPYTDRDIPIGLGWKLRHKFGTIYNPYVFERSKSRITLSAAGNTIACSTSTNIEVWGIETGYKYSIQHPRDSKTNLKFLTLSEDGTHLAACYEPDGPGSARVLVWKVANVCTPRSFFSSCLAKLLWPLGCAWDILRLLFAPHSQSWPSQHTSFTLLTPEHNPVGLTFSLSGDRLAILSASNFGNGNSESSKTNRAPVQTWDTETWKSSMLTHRTSSHQLPSSTSLDDDTSTQCLNVTFSSVNEIVVLWQSCRGSSEERFQHVEFLNLAHSDDAATVIVDLPFHALSGVCLNPEPFWAEGGNIHVSHGYFRMIPRTAEVIESLCFYKNFTGSGGPRRSERRVGISHNDQQFLWYPFEYSDRVLFVCGRHTFVLFDNKKGNLKFIEMPNARRDTVGEQ